MSPYRGSVPPLASLLLPNPFDRRQKHPERPHSRLLPFRKTPLPLEPLQRPKRFLEVGFELRQVLVSVRSRRQWHVPEGGCQGLAGLPLFLLIPSSGSPWSVRQPGHLLGRSVSFASPPRGGFAFVVERLIAPTTYSSTYMYHVYLNVSFVFQVRRRRTPELRRTPSTRTSENTPSETVWKIAEGLSRVLHRRLEAAYRAPLSPLDRLQNPCLGMHPNFPNSFSTHSAE
jgi:hypothetical protein